jgi:uncharacterized membrane protein
MKLRKNLYTFFVWWSVIGVGIYVGGTLFMMDVVNPQWSANPPESVQFYFSQTGFNKYIGHFFGLQIAIFRNTLPILIALILGWKSKTHRQYLLISLSCSIAIILFTVVYIYPINEVLITKAGGDKTAGEIRLMVNQWIFADRLRFAVNLVGYFFLLLAFRKPFDWGSKIQKNP